MDILKKGLGKLAEVASGGIGGLAADVVEIVKGQFPDKQKQAEIELKIKDAAHRREIESLKAWNEQERSFQEHTQKMEGTASDLLKIWGLGHFMIFLRGCIRPVWCFVFLYADMKVFSGEWSMIKIASGDAELAAQLTGMLWLINVLILITVFGERAVKNLMPVIERFFEFLFNRKTKNNE